MRITHTCSMPFGLPNPSIFTEDTRQEKTTTKTLTHKGNKFMKCKEEYYTILTVMLQDVH